MIKLEVNKRNLQDVQTLITEKDNSSFNFLNITSLSDKFTAGKNVFKIKPNLDNISLDYPVDIEILYLN